MEIKIKDVNSFAKNNGIIMYDKITEIYEVVAVLTQKKKVYYLIKYDGIPRLYESKFFDIISEKIPDYWIFKYFKYNNVIKNKKYMFDITVDMYMGPKELIDNDNFFFDIIDEPQEAIYILYDTLKKYGKEWRTPPQT